MSICITNHTKRDSPKQYNPGYTCTHGGFMDVATRLRAKMAECDLNESELGRRSGVPQPTINRILSGESSSPRRPTIEKVARVLRTSPTWLMFGSGDETTPFESNVEAGPPIVSAARRIDIVGTAQMGPDGHWVGLDNAGGWVETWSRDTDAYALLLRGDSMAPAIRNGWVAVCEPNHRLVPGEYVMVTTTDGQSMVKELLFQNDTGVSLMSINAAYERRTIPWTEIETIHYVGAILGPSKVLGRI